MQLPGPVRAAVGFVASTADEARHLPDRAIELPMLAVSTALQMSLRLQQRYARLTARGDDVLHRRRTGDEPPDWATFDEPVAADRLRRDDAGAHSATDSAAAAGELLDQLFGSDSPNGKASGDKAAGEAEAQPEPAADTAPADTKAQEATAEEATAEKSTAQKSTAQKSTAQKSTAQKSTAQKSTAQKSTAQKSTAGATGQKSTARKQAARKSAAKKTSDPKGTTRATKSSAQRSAKTVSKPRHTSPSRFDDVGDD